MISIWSKERVLENWPKFLIALMWPHLTLIIFHWPEKVTTPALTTTTTPPTPPKLSDECLDVCPEAALYLPPDDSSSFCPAQCEPITESTKSCHAIREMATLEPPSEYSMCSIVGIKKYENVSCIGTCENCDQSGVDLFTGKMSMNCPLCQPAGIKEHTMRLRCPDGTKTGFETSISYFTIQNCSCQN